MLIKFTLGRQQAEREREREREKAVAFMVPNSVYTVCQFVTECVCIGVYNELWLWHDSCAMVR